METRKKEALVVKKIKPYPIPVTLIKAGSSTPVLGDIVRVTTLGFQMEVTNVLFHIGEIYSVDFTLTLTNHHIKEDVKIVKTMDRFLDQKATVKGYLIELHFLKITPNHSKLIATFEKTINQKLP